MRYPPEETAAKHERILDEASRLFRERGGSQYGGEAVTRHCKTVMDREHEDERRRPRADHVGAAESHGIGNDEPALRRVHGPLGEAAPPLLQIYGGMSARPDQQQGFFDTLTTSFTTSTGTPVTLQQTPDWQVAIDGVQYADNPNFESAMPHYNESLDILNRYQSRWTGTPGLDMDAEYAQLTADLQAVWDKQ